MTSLSAASRPRAAGSPLRKPVKKTVPGFFTELPHSPLSAQRKSPSGHFPLTGSTPRASTKSLRSAWHRAVVTVLVATRHEAHLTQDQLAHRLGWHRTRLAKIESYERRIDVPEFIQIANAINVSADTLLARVLRW